jgi:arsenite-transporting ATPase
VEAAERLSAELAGVRETLSASGASVRLVMTAEAGALHQARHAWTILALHGLALDGVVVNRLVPAEGNDPWRRARSAAQGGVLADADASFTPLPVARLAERPVPPAGTAGLAELAQELYDDALPSEQVAPGPAARGLGVERRGDEFVLVLPLPLAHREELELGRRGDELVVDLAGERRVLTLPSALRRCEVTGAALRGGALRVAFRPDPALWRLL